MIDVRDVKAYILHMKSLREGGGEQIVSYWAKVIERGKHAVVKVSRYALGSRHPRRTYAPLLLCYCSKRFSNKSTPSPRTLRWLVNNQTQSSIQMLSAGVSKKNIFLRRGEHHFVPPFIHSSWPIVYYYNMDHCVF